MGLGSDPVSGSDPSAHPYERLSPDVIVDAVEAAGFLCDGRVLALGSYENRVYQVGVEDAEPVVVKFYRPGRWSDEAILEEHGFALELVGEEIPVIAPLRLPQEGSDPQGGSDPGQDQEGSDPQGGSDPGQDQEGSDPPSGSDPGMGLGSDPLWGSDPSETLLRHAGFRYAIYPRRGGQWPELATAEDRQWMGRFLGRIHMVGARRAFEHRPRLSIEAMGRGSAEYLLESDFIPEYIAHRYERVAGELVELVEARFEAVGPVRFLRLHGDCHRNNVLWTEQGPHFVDLDDCMMGPAIQDLWMLLAGSSEEMRAQLDDLLEGYSQFADFDLREAALIEPLRALRMMHYAAWLARRWEDPAFPRAFPWFGEARYWERHVAELEEQVHAVGES